MAKSKRRARNAKPVASAKPVDASTPVAATGPGRRSSLLAIALLLVPWCGLLASLRPVSVDDLWWQVARGDVVVRGQSIAPSRAILVHENLAEADWLGGAMVSFSYHFAGFAGLYASKLLLAIALTLLLRRGAKTQPASAFILFTAVVLALTDPVMAPAGRGLDLLLLTGMSLVLRCEFKFQWRRLLLLAAVACAWANLGPLMIFAIPLACLSGKLDDWRRWSRELGLVLLAGSLNPRGLWAWRDSLALAAPWLWESHSTLQETPFAFASFADPLTLLFILLAVYVLAAKLSAIGRGDISPTSTATSAAAWALATATGLLSVYCLPLCGLWLAIQAFSDDGAPHRVGWGDGCRWASAILLLTAGGLGWIGSPHGFGYGLAAKLEPRLFALAIDNSPRGAAFTWGALSAGVAAVNGLQPTDTPGRALVGGRLMELRQAVEDVRNERRNRYRRTDGRWGGWWLWLQEDPAKPITWIVASSKDRLSLRGLEATAYRPVSIDSPVIPFASTFQSETAPAVLRVLPLQNAVAFEDWSYEPPHHGGLFVDLPHSLGWDQAERRRQAGAFWAMKLPNAALRVLQPPGHDDGLRLACYRDLADREQRVAGRPSDWTRTVLDELDFRSRKRNDASSPGSGTMTSAVQTYLANGPEAALQVLLSDNSPASLSGAAQMQLEMGSASKAKTTLQRLVDAFPEDPHSLGARDVLRSLP